MGIGKLGFCGALLLSLVMLGGAAPATQEAPPLPHWEALQKQFKEMTGGTAMAAPFRQVDALQRLLADEKIDDKELAAAALKFVAENRQAGEAILLVISGTMFTAHQSFELASVWTAALNSKDKDTLVAAMTCLEFLELRRNEHPSFEDYTSVLMDAPDDMNLALVKYMYAHDASQAFGCLVRATRNVSPARREASNRRERELLFAQHMIEHAVWLLDDGFTEGRDDAVKTAAAQVAKLAEAPEWWARLYAAETISRHHEFRTPGVVRKLAEDTHPAVREAVKNLPGAEPATQPATKVSP